MLHKLIVVVMLLMLSLVMPVTAEDLPSSSQTGKPQEVKYPPYPDVWGYEFPWRKEGERGLQISVQKASGGDYAVTYLTSVGMKDGKAFSSTKGIYFFSGKEMKEKNVKVYREKSHIAGNSVGRSDVMIDDEVSWQQRLECLGCCPEFSKFPITKYAPTKTNEQLSVIYFSEEPVRRYYHSEVFDNCVEEAGWQRFEEKFYYTQVFDAYPFFVPLKDGTFLLYDSFGNFILRFDKDFNSKSELLNKKVFMVNTSDVKAIENRLFKEYEFNRQTYSNAVTEYIKALKRGNARSEALKEALDSIDKIAGSEKTKAILSANRRAYKAYKQSNAREAVKIVEINGIKDILEKRPEDMPLRSYIRILDNYALYLSETGDRYVDSIMTLKRIMNLSQDRNATYLSLGDVYMKWYKGTNNNEYKKEAKEYYKKYLEKGKQLKIPARVFDVINEDGEKYTSYPDIWDWYEPSTEGHPFSMYRLHNGDILIEYTKRSSEKKKKLEDYAVTFFERKLFAGEDARRIIKKAEEDMQKRGGRDLQARLNYMNYEAISPDGIWNIKSIIPYDLNCYAGPNRHPYKLTNTKTSEERIFTIFRLLDKTEKFYIREMCGQPGTTVKYKVKSVYGGFFFLEDNSFLFHVEETGEVIRFDSDLKSKSNLVGDRFFLIENDGDEWGGIEKLTGREYDDAVDPQVITNYLYHYLKNKKKGRK